MPQKRTAGSGYPAVASVLPSGEKAAGQRGHFARPCRRDVRPQTYSLYWVMGHLLAFCRQVRMSATTEKVAS